MPSTAVLKLGSVVTDRATGLTGTLTHWIMYLGGRVDYIFQPRGLTEEGQPKSRVFCTAERFIVPSSDMYEHVETPTSILGTQVADKASGFNGMAMAFIYHINGCFHVEIQPKGEYKGELIKSAQFDLRQCEGEAIVALTKEGHAASIQRNPSPEGIPGRTEYGDRPVRR